MAVALSPASSARLRPQSAARFISFLNNITTGRNVLTGFRTLTNKAPTFPPFLHCYPGVRHLRRDSPAFNRRCFSSAIVGAISSEEAVEKAKKEFLEKPDVGTGQKVREFRKRLRIADIKGGPDEGLDRVGQTLVVKGWVRTLRVQRSITFMEVNDGSCLSNMQCVINSDAEGYDQVESGSISTGASVWVEGAIVESQGSGQKVELRVTKVITVGKSDPSFPIQKKRISREFLRTKAHLRPRTNTFGAVSRVRNALAYATHKFFQENGFVWISSPIVTASDCEGAGEQFCVTTLIPSSRDASDSLVDTIPKTDDGLIDWSQDFFGKPAFLTVSGQLNAETYASALCDVYTFGPTFRAENSNTSRHLAEFWMIEPELAFADLSDDMACATAYLKYVVKWGCDLQSEHERYVTEEAFAGCPVIITDYPKEIKAFYMRLNDDGSTVAAMDVLVPRVGELIGGSQREERLEYLEDRLDELKLNKETYWWYLDLRRFGSVDQCQMAKEDQTLFHATILKPFSSCRFWFGLRKTCAVCHWNREHKGCNTFPTDTRLSRILMPILT
ncbi:PREDICTED: asparagine--tRNA ligase, chloroplastic/mitochondrial isoform X4 [Nelumbo nucifera]|uniref:Asparagine--tRNA ligase, chloroplastic/mitochondrial isoform X4 n=1 Tax=Nelumbo nucifera TaxID=4432 RepID=A0A1U8AA73_NELNU|nr:PREDICTED: asparagine--tRNA ligase, chloroplastic/mitochondrial isoform X4 [Nelumbo nucifera]